ncbi:MAG TPA: energy transducer TonB [Bacteroidales bacterium]|nr:energy transducer TonB [Bacteroidales bacterium]HPS73020.1 energy transducer TonB [Bacteroidales bacterium]
MKLPEYAGGSRAISEFVAMNLRYPDEALKAGIEGAVLVKYRIDDNGNVFNPQIIKSLGYGCDEEAIRLISLLRFEKVRNRGQRVEVTKTTKINFKLPGLQINYSLAPKTESPAPQRDPGQKKDDSIRYNYTIDL